MNPFHRGGAGTQRKHFFTVNANRVDGIFNILYPRLCAFAVKGVFS